jgi:hypothetical protein
MKSLLEIPHMRKKSNLPATGTTIRHAEKLGGELNAEDTSDQLIFIHIYTAHLSILKASVTLDIKHGIKKCDTDYQSLYTIYTHVYKKYLIKHKK